MAQFCSRCMHCHPCLCDQAEAQVERVRREREERRATFRAELAGCFCNVLDCRHRRAAAGEVAHRHVAPAVDLVVTKALEAAADELLRRRARARRFAFTCDAIVERVQTSEPPSLFGPMVAFGERRARARIRPLADEVEPFELPIAVAQAYRLMDAMSYRPGRPPKVRITIEVEE